MHTLLNNHQSRPNMITISIIIPVYQAEPYICQCLNSLIHQNLEHYEVICIDDGSTDKSANLIKQYTQKYPFIHYYYQTNHGVSAARNYGLDKASGQYVMFVDSDDWIRPNSLKYLFRKAQQFSLDILVYGGQASRFFDTSEWIRDAFFTKNKLYRNNSIEALLFENGARPSVCNKLFSHEILKGIRFAEHITISEDQAFLFSVFPKAKTVMFCEKNIYRYRIENDKSAMHQIRLNQTSFFQNHLDTVSYILKEWRTYNLLDSEGQKLQQWAVSFLDIYYFLSLEQKQYFSEQLQKLSGELHFNITDALTHSKYKAEEVPFFLKKYFCSVRNQLKKYGLKYGTKSVILKIWDKYSN